MSQARYSSVLVRFAIGAVLMLSASAAFAQTLAGGTNHSVILKDDGTVWTAGHNGVGQLGDGTYTARSSPVETVTGSDGYEVVFAYDALNRLTSQTHPDSTSETAGRRRNARSPGP